MEELWDDMCKAWDEELLTTEDIKRLAAMIFPLPLLVEVVEEIELLELSA